jgi:hypothetical protein
MEHIFFVTVRIKAESPLDIDNAMQEFSAETTYQFNDTENVKVISAEIAHADIHFL